MDDRTLKPGYLVSVSTRISGGTHRTVEELPEEIGDDQVNGAVDHKKVTTVTDNPEEWEQACKARNDASNWIRSACLKTAFGPLCPFDRVEKLDAAVVRAQEAVTAFNADAQFSQVAVRVLRGRVAATDTEAIDALTGEARDLISAMQAGILAADDAAIRKAATEAKMIGQALDGQAAETLADVVKEARKAARTIKVRKAGGESAVAVGGDMAEALILVNRDRFAFLDLDPADTAADDPVLPGLDLQRFDLDMAPPESMTPPPPPLPAPPVLDLDTDPPAVAAPAESDDNPDRWAGLLED